MSFRIVRDDVTNKIVAFVLVFGNMDGAGPWVPRMGLPFAKKSRLFPGVVALHLRDQHGVNPGALWAVLQYGERSPEMPYGYRGTYRSLFLLGDRLSPTFKVKQP